jgi:hypothetical protein
MAGNTLFLDPHRRPPFPGAISPTHEFFSAFELSIEQSKNLLIFYVTFLMEKLMRNPF